MLLSRPGLAVSARVRTTLLALSLVLTVALLGCGHAVSPGHTRPSKTKLERPVELGRAEQRALEYQVDTVGYLEAEGQTELAAGVSGVVDTVLFREGQWVDPNTILVKVDQRRYLASAEVARANERRAQATVELARDLDYRIRQLGRNASDEERTKAALNLRSSEADLAASVAARALAENNLERSQVRAPYGGQINQRKVTPGSFLEDRTVIATMADLRQLRLVGWVPEKAAATVRELLAQQELIRTMRLMAACASGGRPFSVIAEVLRDGAAGVYASYGHELAELNFASQLAVGGPSPWTLLAEVAQRRIGGGQSSYGLEFTVLPFPQRPLLGRIFYLSTVASPDTHMFECKAEANAAGLNLELKPGYTARIRVPLRSNPNACVVPEEAVRATERGFIAFVPTPGTTKEGQTQWVASARTLELGYRANGKVEVRKGIAPGEWIVVKGAESLENGTPIRFAEVISP